MILFSVTVDISIGTYDGLVQDCTNSIANAQ